MPDLEFHLLKAHCRELIEEARADRLAAELATRATPGPSLFSRLRRLRWNPGLGAPTASTTKAAA